MTGATAAYCQADIQMFVNDPDYEVPAQLAAIANSRTRVRFFQARRPAAAYDRSMKRLRPR